MPASINYTARRGVKNLGSEIISTLSESNSDTDVYGIELNTSDNALAIGNLHERDATAGISSSGLSGANIFESQTHTVNPNTSSRYAIHADANDTPTSAAGISIDLNAAPYSCVVGKHYYKKFWARHVGAGDDWTFYLWSTTDASSTGEATIVALTNTDTTWKQYALIWTHSSDSRFIVGRETGSNNSGGFYFDDLSVQEIELSGATDTELLINAVFSADVSWTNGSGWSIAAGRLTASAAASSDSSQAAGLTLGTRYATVLPVSAISSGIVNVRVGNTGTGTSRTTNATFSEELTCTGDTVFYIEKNDTFNGTVDNLSVRPVVLDLGANNNGLTKYGQVMKAPVAEKAQFSAFTNFKATNYLLQEYNSNLDPGTSDISAAYWFRVPAVSASNYILERSDDSSIAQRFFSYLTSTGTLKFSVDDNATLEETATTASYDDGEWHHAVCVYDASNSSNLGEVKIYIDNNLVITNTFTALLTLTNTAAKLFVGVSNALATPFTGDIAGLKIYTEVITRANITSIYNSELHLFAPYSIYHVNGVSYYLDMTMEEMTKSTATKNMGQEAWSGKISTLTYNTKNSFQIGTTEINGHDLGPYREFIYNVSGRNSFTFNPGAGYYPSEDLTVYLDTDSYIEERLGTEDIHKLSMRFKDYT